MKEEHQDKSKLIEEVLAPLRNVLTKYVVTFAPDLPDASKESLQSRLNLLLACTSTIFEFRAVYYDLTLTLEMAKQYPRGESKVITRSKHLEFVWFQSVDICYLFKEKYKRFGNLYNRVMKTFKRSAIIDVSDGLKKIDRHLQKYIRTRGQNVHEGSAESKHITTLSSIELIYRIGHVSDDMPTPDVVYTVARDSLIVDINEALNFIQQFTLDTFVAVSYTHLTLPTIYSV